MEVTLSEVLTVYGPLGLLALIGLVATIHMFRLLTKERAEAADVQATLASDHKKELHTMITEHKAEMQIMVDRYIQTTTTQINQYHSLAEKLHTMVESIARRLDRKG